MRDRSARSNRHVFGVPLAALWLLVAAPLSLLAAAASANRTVVVLTHPESRCALRLDLPGFVFEALKSFRNGAQVWTAAQNRDTGVTLMAFISMVGRAHDAVSCRRYYLKSFSEAPESIGSTVRKGMALAEWVVPASGSETSARKSLHAYLFQDGACVDIHLIKSHFEPGQEGQLYSVLDGVSVGPASDAELQATAAYTISSGPGEELVAEAARRLRARDFNAAESILASICHWTSKRPTEKELFSTAECGLLASAMTERRGSRGAKDLADMYWRAADMARRDGGLQAAETIYLKSLDLDPKSLQTWYSLGQVYREQKNMDEALDALRHALELKPGSAEIAYWVGVTLADQGKTDEAIATLERAQLADIKDGRIPFRIALLQMKRSNYSGAIEWLEKARAAGFDAKQVAQRIEECRQAMDKGGPS